MNYESAVDEVIGVITRNIRQMTLEDKVAFMAALIAKNQDILEDLSNQLDLDVANKLTNENPE